MMLGQVAYQAYASKLNEKDSQGNSLPTWYQLPIDTQIAWDAAAEKAIEAARIHEPLAEREIKQVQHALEYKRRYQDSGVPGHGQFLLIAKLALALGLHLEYPESDR